MKATKDTIEFVKEFNGKGHNPQTVFAVMLREGGKHELREYSLHTLPKVIKNWVSDRDFEVWYYGTELLTYCWKREYVKTTRG